MSIHAPSQIDRWLARNALHLVVALLVALFGWSANRTLDQVAADIALNTARLERLSEAVGEVLIDQASHARRLEHLERRLDHVERRLEANPSRSFD